jgi:hypothetical protein
MIPCEVPGPGSVRRFSVENLLVLEVLKNLSEIHEN